MHTYRATYAPYRLIFKSPSGTSRGILTVKDTYFLKIWYAENPDIFGIGECALFKGLSKEDNDTYEEKLKELCRNIGIGAETDLAGYSSIMFGLECAINDLANGGKRIYFPSDFADGNADIVINGLVWMGTHDEMLKRIDEKVALGFNTIKLKVGAIDLESELSLLKHIRNRYSSLDLTVRIDANGGFKPENALETIDKFAKYDVHSLEQPIKQGNWNEMARICRNSSIPIALDEELIGITDIDERIKLVETIKPKYLIIKPSLLGGLASSEMWLRIAASHDIGAWITSALESNIGLNAIAEWTYTLQPRIAQGLGTGGLFTNNIESPLYLESEHLRKNKKINWTLPEFDWK